MTFIVGQICRADDIRWCSWNSTHRTAGSNARSKKGKATVKEESDDWVMDCHTLGNDSDADTKELSELGNDTTSSRSQAQALDRLCLALGLLVNIVQEVAAAKDILREAGAIKYLLWLHFISD